MKRILSVFLSILFLLTALPLGAVTVAAATYGDYTYTISNGEVTITGYTGTQPADLVIPATIEGYPVTTIGDYAFYECTSLTSVTIPDSVTTIGDSAFANCDSLTTVAIPDSVTTIGMSAFSGCTSLMSVTIPDSVTTIGLCAFFNCTSLTSVTIGNSVTTIKVQAFCRCTSLTEVTIPNSVTTISSGAFAYCTSLTTITVSAENPNYISVDGVLFNKDKTTLIQYPGGNPGAYIIPDSVTTIGSSAFYGCKNLASVIIPNNVTTIADHAFVYCTRLTTVTIPDSVTTIGDGAFYDCDSLTDVYYTGSEADRENIEIGGSNNDLLNATWHYNCCAHAYDNAYDPDCNICGEVREMIPGDADGDGVLNSRDLAALQRYLNGWDVTVYDPACDLNDDGKLNNKDFVLLQRYLNGWDLELG